MDQIRSLLGESKINYFGYSYGTFLGATYANLFPKNYRAMVLDGPIDATAYINKPWRDLAEQTPGFERARNRFFQACAADQASCAGFGGSDPWDAYDQLVEQANAHPIPAPNSAGPASGGRRRHQLRRPPTSSMPRSSGASSPRRLPRPRPATARSSAISSTAATAATTTGRSSNGLDLYFTIGASEQRYPRDVDFYLDVATRRGACSTTTTGTTATPS